MSRMRHRELLLSLKASTIEACFSVPMLNLTMPSFPFVIAFAVAALGWGPAGVGLMAALPHLCNLVQPALSVWLRGRYSLHQIIQVTFILNALPWAFVSALPLVSPVMRTAGFAIILTLGTLANCVCAVTWSAAIAELVPARIAGTFFGKRNLIFGFWTLLVVIAASQLAQRYGSTLTVYGWIFVAGSAARMIGFFYFTRMSFPRQVLHRAPTPPDWAELAAPFRDRNYLVLAAFIGLWGFFLNMGQPFYPVFLLTILHRPVGDVGWLTALAGVGALLTLRGWGRLSDRFGVKPVLYVCSMFWALIALASWSFAGTRWHLHVGLCYLLVGGATAGFQLCQFNLMLKLAPANKAPHVAVFVALTSALTALGPLVGGLMLRWLPEDLGTVLGQGVHHFHLVFAISMLGCLLSIHVLDRVREEAAHGPEAVWRTMRGMRTFNPLLSVTTAAQLLFTPRAVVGITRDSVRSLKRHAKRIGDVGEEIMEGGRDAIRSRLPGDRD